MKKDCQSCQLSKLLLIFLFVVAFSEEFYSTVKARNILGHLKQLDIIAKNHSNCRTQSSGGFKKTLDYIHGQLQSRGYFTFQYQKFMIPTYEILEKPQFKSQTQTFIYKKDFEMNLFSGSGNITAPTQLIDNFGCKESDFTNFRPGNIALIRRGLCFFSVKAENAKKMKAGGVVFINSDEYLYSLSAGNGINFPVFFVGKTLGETFLKPNTRLNLFSKNLNGEEETMNLIVDTVQGDDNNIIVIGAHADGAPEGPGINDNGSGVAAILETAIQMAIQRVNPINKIRFCWWAAEEIGLLGSIHYLKTISEEERKKIVLNLNFDMIGSPNYIRAIYNGGASTVDPRIRTASGNIQKVFENHFKKLGLDYELSPFDGRSDYGPFIEHLIPAGGLATGAEGIKTESQRARFGGIAGVSYDPCYHQRCDDFHNVHKIGVEEMSQNAANAIYFFGLKKNVREFLRIPIRTDKITTKVELGHQEFL